MTLRDLRLHLRQFNWLTAFAILCVAGTSVFIIIVSFQLIDILSAPDWCARAINAEKLAATRSNSAIEACMDLLKMQVGALATNLQIYAGTIALALLVLIVIVVAKGRLDLAVAKGEVKANIGADMPPVPVTVTNSADEPIPVEGAEVKP